MKHIDSNITELKGKVDFGIITIREDEFEAVLQRMHNKQFVTGRQIYTVSRLQTINRDEYLIASVRCPEQGNSSGQTVTHNLIEDLDPQWIIVVGIAGAVPGYEYTLGDVLLATRLHDFCITASLEGENHQVKQEFSSKGGPMHPAIQNLLAALPAIEPSLERWNESEMLAATRPPVKLIPKNFYGRDQWQKRVRECLKPYFGTRPIRGFPRAFTGSVASSDTLVKDTQLASKWLESARQIIGIEMELAGVYQAAWQAQNLFLQSVELAT